MSDFAPVFDALKTIFDPHVKRLTVKSDTPVQYTLLTKSPSPSPQHKGHPMYFAEVRLGKAYVSFHLMPLYMCPELAPEITPALKKRMQGKTCFNFKAVPGAELLKELEKLTEAAIEDWTAKRWL